MSPDPKNNRGQAVGYIPGLIELGYKNTEIVRWLRDEGMGYNNQNMFADINRIRLETFGAAQIKTLDPDTPIPDKYLKTWEGNTNKGYRVVVKYDYIDKETGELMNTGTTMYFRNRPSENDVRELWEAHRQTLESLYTNVKEAIGLTKVEYFKNIKHKRNTPRS